MAWRETATRTEITGLKPGTAYVVRLRATDGQEGAGNGYGPWSTSPPTTPRGWPPLPKDLTVTPGNGRLDLSWTAPPPPVTGYEVHYRVQPDGQYGFTGNVWCEALQTVAEPSPADGWVDAGHTGTGTTRGIDGLENGKKYMLRLRAVNAEGSAGCTNVDPSRTWVLRRELTPTDTRPVLTFGAESATIMEGEDGTLTAKLDKPASRNLRAIVRLVDDDATQGTDYRVGATSVDFAKGGSSRTLTINVAEDSVNEEDETFTVTLTAEKRYDEHMQLGSPARLVVSIEDDDPPEAPSLSLKAGDGKLAAKWTRPAGPVAGYQLRYKTQDATDGDAPDATPDDPATGWVTKTVTEKVTDPATNTSEVKTSADIDGLENWTTYVVQVRATDGQEDGGGGHYGDWSASLSGMPRGPPGVGPSALGVTPGDARLDLSWTDPPGEVTGHDVHVTAAEMSALADGEAATGTNRATEWVAVQRSGTTRSQAITGLDNGTEYRVRVRARNSQGAGPWSFVKGRPASGDATLLGLSASAGAGAEGEFEALSLTPRIFKAATLGYAATVPGAMTHAKVTAAVNDSGATLTAGKRGTTLAALSSSVESGAIGLAYGENLIDVVVAAQDGTEKTYTVTITRQSDDAALSALAGSVSADGSDFSGTLTLDPAFASGTRSYAATLDSAVTHVKLTPTANHSEAAVTVNGATVTSGQASAAIAVSTGRNNVIEVEVTAEDGTAQAYVVTARHKVTALTLTSSATNGTVAENAGTLTVTATLDNPAGKGGVTVELEAGAASTAEAADDYVLPAPFTIAEGDTSAAGEVTIVDDDVAEANEALALAAQVSGVTVTGVTVTIADDDEIGIAVLPKSPGPVRGGRRVDDGRDGKRGDLRGEPEQRAGQHGDGHRRQRRHEGGHGEPGDAHLHGAGLRGQDGHCHRRPGRPRQS